MGFRVYRLGVSHVFRCSASLDYPACVKLDRRAVCMQLMTWNPAAHRLIRALETKPDILRQVLVRVCRP